MLARAETTIDLPKPGQSAAQKGSFVGMTQSSAHKIIELLCSAVCNGDRKKTWTYD